MELKNKFFRKEILTDDREQASLVVARGVVPDGVRKRFPVLALVSFLDVLQVDFGSRNDDPYERLVVRSHAIHGPVQSSGEILRPVPDGGNQGQKRVLRGAGKFVFYGGFERMSDQLLVLVEDQSQLGPVPLAEDLVEGRFVGALEEFARSQQLLGVFVRFLLVRLFRFVAVALNETGNKTL